MKVARISILAVGMAAAQSGHNPATLLEDARALASPSDLPLAPSVTSTVYRAEEGQWQFNLHSYITFHQGKFWAMWSAGKVDEDSGQQRIHYATSADGHHWSAAEVLAEDPDGPDGPALWIARGIFTQKGHLYALAAYNEGHKQQGDRRESWHNLDLVRFEWTGKSWRKLGTYVHDCMNNFPPRPFGDHLVMTCRNSYADMSTAVSTDLTGNKWTVTKLPGDPPGDRMSEPSWYVDPQGTGHLIFRDGRGSKHLYQSLSHDQGKTWTAPVLTDYPDATSKNITGRLSNGTYFLINNPVPKSRDPLAISFSSDGWTFSHPLALRKGAPARRYAGRSKSVGFQYPHAMEHGGSLWVIYSTDKEDIEISEFKLADLSGAAHSPERLLNDSAALSDPAGLAEVKGRHTVAFRGEAGKSGFNLHSYLAHFDGRFWLCWSSAMVNEEDPDQHILYSTSADGHSWSAAQVLVADPDGPTGPQRWIARGMFVEGGKLRALGALVESADYKNRGKSVVWRNLQLIRFTWTGKAWARDSVFADDCMNNFPPERLHGLYVMPCRDSDMNLKVGSSDAPAAHSWKFIPIASEAPFDRMDEPTLYVAADGVAQMIIRDGSHNGTLIRSISRDQGVTWTHPVRTNYLDATSKNFVMRLSDGRYVLINNPDPKRRDPLGISFSRDGWVFDHPAALRKNGAPRRNTGGRMHSTGSFQYPHAMEHGGSLWVAYSTNKEDIEVSEYRLSDLESSH